MSRKNNGKAFEEDFRQSFSERYWTYRPHDSGGGMMARFTHESLCDLIAFDTEGRNLTLFELKSTVNNSFNFRPVSEVTAYHELKLNFEEWNASLGVEGRRKHKEEVKERRKEVRDAYKKLNGAMIKFHQITTLIDTQEQFGVRGYFVFTFIDTQTTFLINIDDFVYLWKNTPKKSLNQKDLTELVESGRGVLLPQENKTPRSARQSYEIEDILEKY